MTAWYTRSLARLLMSLNPWYITKSRLHVPAQNTQFMPVPEIPMPSPFRTNARVVLRVSPNFDFFTWVIERQPVCLLSSDTPSPWVVVTWSPAIIMVYCSEERQCRVVPCPTQSFALPAIPIFTYTAQILDLWCTL